MRDPKIYKWFAAAKDIASKNRDILIVHDAEEFIEFVNLKVPKEIRISKHYFDQVIYENPNTASLEDEFKEDFKDWWKLCRYESELELYSIMTKTAPDWKLYDNILHKRFSVRNNKWIKKDHLQLNADVNAKVDQNITINFKQKID